MAEYISSCVDHTACPVAPQHPEFAVIGRSNVGKSSLINMLTGSRRLAKVSKEPGGLLHRQLLHAVCSAPYCTQACLQGCEEENKDLI